MAPIKFISFKILFFLLFIAGIFLTKIVKAQTNKQVSYNLIIKAVDKDSSFNFQELGLQTRFVNKDACSNYIGGIINQLQAKGYPTVSVDSVVELENSTTIQLFLGKKYLWVKLHTDSIEKIVLDYTRYRPKDYDGKLLNIPQLVSLQHKIVNYYENNGYPFVQVYLDSILLENDKMEAMLRTNKGPIYKIDSIRILGRGKISKNFLYHYLNIAKASLYNSQKLQLVNKKIQDLPYLQQQKQSDITMLGTGAILNLYLEPRRSSQVNFLVGLLPNANQSGKLQLTADVNLDLKNAIGNGENILLKWQQLQPKSPRLNVGFQQPYIFNTNFGLDFLFDLFKKDSSFLQVNAQLGIQYLLSANQSGKIFVQWQNNFLLGTGVDTNLVKATKMLPPNIDVKAVNVGLDYDWSKTDYRLNPRSGNEIKITGVVGIKNIKPNTDILNIKDTSFNYSGLYDSVKSRSYQLRVKLSAAHYFPVGKQATVKTAINTAVFVSPSTFRNELFQLGGYKLLRGFNEESIYASRYAVLTAEYRYRLALNSYIFGFIDGALVKNSYQNIDVNNNFFGAGLGLAFETKFGLLNISYAAGKRNDVKFNIREASKIHFGYVNYF